MEEILEYLSRHRSEFSGVEWRPRNLLPASTVQRIYEQTSALYRDLLSLPLHSTPRGARMVEWRKEMRWALDAARKHRQMDQAAFVQAISVAYENANRILESLRRLELSSGASSRQE